MKNPVKLTRKWHTSET